MASLDMSLDSMIQNNRGTRVRGGGRGMGLRGVRGSGGTCRGARQLDTHPNRGPLILRGVRGSGGTFGGAMRLDGHSCRGPLGLKGVRGPGGGTFGGARRVDKHPCRGPLGLRGVRGPGGGTFGGARRLDKHHCRGPLGLRGVRGPGGTFRGAMRLDRHACRGSLGLKGLRGPGGGTFGGARRSNRHPCRDPLGMYAITKRMHGTRNLTWQNSVLEDRFKAVRSSGEESGTKLLVSNLSAGASNEDIWGLFSEIGELISYEIHNNKDGSPCGSAEIVFARSSDAFQAVKRYNNTDLDGKPMKIEKVGSMVTDHVSRLNMFGGANGRRTRRARPGPGYTSDAGVLNNGVGSSSQRGHSGWNGGVPIHGRGRCGGGRGRGHGGLGGRTVEKSSEELEKELENQQAGSSQT